MKKSKTTSNRLVFGLDIGTRSIVGSVGYLEQDRFKVLAHCVKEHDTRSMLDGQIHDIQKVGATILYVKTQLEQQLDKKLTEVCIAAAGRVLKTVTVHVEIERPDDEVILGADIYSLEMAGIEKAYEEIQKEELDMNFFCVGYTVVKYFLNDYVIGNLEGHKGKKISADVLVTFLPDEVVDGLYAAVSIAGLQVVNLTLEPIAAMNVAIPEQFRLLNIALVDVGAGTSDICITKDGSIVAYGMIPHAGDEITEPLVQEYLVDFNTAEKIKQDSVLSEPVHFSDIMGLPQEVLAEDVRKVYQPTVENITREVAAKIKELNGGKSVNAVFVVGGGGKAYGFTELLAKELELSNTRVALRGKEVMGNIDFMQEDVQKDPLLVTPIGICMNYYEQKNSFIFVSLNGERIKLYDNNKLTVAEAAMQTGFPNEALFPRRGQELNFSVNGVHRMIRGEFGEPAQITINGKPANINSGINKNDVIIILESTRGEPAVYRIEQLAEYKSEIAFQINQKHIICPKFVKVGEKLVPGDYLIQQNDDILILDYYTLEQLLQFLDINPEDKAFYVNNVPVSLDEKVYENFKVSWTAIEESYDEDENEDENEIEENSAEENNTEEQNIEEEQIKEESPKEEKEPISITVTVNQTPVVLNGKPSYIFVDILDVYPFDTSVAKGDALILTVNGQPCDFTWELQNQDILELYWK